MSEIDWSRLTERPEERELRRKIRREAIKNARGGITAAALGGLLLWLFIAATPRQASAVNDLEPSLARLGTGEPRPSGRGTGQGEPSLARLGTGEPSLARLGTEQEDRRE